MSEAKHSCGLDIAAPCAACGQKVTAPTGEQRDAIPDLGAFVDWVWALKTDRDQLKTENDTLKAAAMGIRDAWREDQAELESLRKACREPSQSTKRYQWLSQQEWFQWALDEQFGTTETLQEQDEQIDAAIAAAGVTDQRDNQNLTRQEVE